MSNEASPDKVLRREAMALGAPATLRAMAVAAVATVKSGA
jgi:hypothetical protein